MRMVLGALLCAGLLVGLSGCGRSGPKVELPKQPAPMPQNLQLETAKGPSAPKPPSPGAPVPGVQK